MSFTISYQSLLDKVTIHYISALANKCRLSHAFAGGANELSVCIYNYGTLHLTYMFKGGYFVGHIFNLPVILTLKKFL